MHNLIAMFMYCCAVNYLFIICSIVDVTFTSNGHHMLFIYDLLLNWSYSCIYLCMSLSWLINTGVDFLLYCKGIVQCLLSSLESYTFQQYTFFHSLTENKIKECTVLLQHLGYNILLYKIHVLYSTCFQYLY